MSSRSVSSSSSVRMASLVPDTEKHKPAEGGQESKAKKSYGTANMDSEGKPLWGARWAGNVFN